MTLRAMRTAEQFEADLQRLLIVIAQHQDSQLTDAELAAVLDVYQEFGR